MPKVAPQFRFAAPAQRPRNHLWTINRVDVPTEYICLRAQLTQAILNPLTIGFALLAVFLHIFYLFGLHQIQAWQDSAAMVCTPGNLEAFAKQQSSGIHTTQQMFTANLQDVIKAGLDSYTVTVVNLKESTAQQASQLSTIYEFAANTLPVAAQVAMGNTTATINAWLEPKLENARNVTGVLLSAISEVGEALESSGLYSLNRAKIEDAFNIQMPKPSTASFEPLNLSSFTDSVSEQITATTHNATLQLQALKAKPLSGVGFNFTGNSNKLGCLGIDADFLAMKKSCALVRTTAVSIFAIFAFASILLSCFTCYLDWKNALSACRAIQSQLASTMKDRVHDPMLFLNESRSFATKTLTELASSVVPDEFKVYTKWAASYCLSKTMIAWISVSLWVLLLAIPVSVLGSKLNSVPRLNLRASGTNSQSTLDQFVDRLNDNVANHEAYLNLAAKSVLTTTLTALNNQLQTHQDKLNQVIAARFKGTVEDIQPNIERYSALKRIAAPQLKLPRLNSRMLNEISDPALSLGSSKAQSIVLQCSKTLWITFAVMCAITVVWTSAASGYAYVMAKMGKGTEPVNRTLRTQIIISKQPGDECAEPLSPPILPPRDPTRPNFYI